MSFVPKRRKVLSCAAIVVMGLCLVGVASARLLGLDDLQREHRVSNAQLSPDSRWVAYEVDDFDATSGRHVSQLWKVSWDGSQRMQLTYGPYGVSAVRWSPDGRYLSFLSSRYDDDAVSQVWALDSAGGEARPLTDVGGGVSAYAWSPDGKRLALVVAPKQPKPEQDAKPQPIVIDRYQFKSEFGRYHGGVAQQARIHLYDMDSKRLVALTAGPDVFGESDPSWSPDGTRVAFVSNREQDWERDDNADVWVAEATGNAVPRRVTRYPGWDFGPVAWSPDGKFLTYMQGQERKYRLYQLRQVAVIPVAGGTPVLPTQALDRDTTSPRFTPDGRHLEFLVTDSRSQYLGRVPVMGGKVERLVEGERYVTGYSHVGQRIVVVSGTTDAPFELHARERGGLRALSAHNAAWLADVQLSRTRDFEFTAPDGAQVQGLLTLPSNARQGERRPLLLWIHGGPYGQDGHFFDLETQLFAANGYAVARINYRGSSGRGLAFARGIYADWGNKDRVDLIAGVDYLIEQGVADPDRLAVGGWSQGGILTNYIIARDTRFKAAIAGAGAGSQIGLYGTDQYVIQYDHEFEPPWVNPQRWLRLSYPFFEANRIKTPTLYVSGLDDFNVPIIGSEQMYQALKSLGIPTQLVIYPGEKHMFAQPYFVRDRMERYLAWYGKYLK